MSSADSVTKARKAPARTLSRLILHIILALYLITWIWGIPAVHSDIAKRVIEDYKTALHTPGAHVSKRSPGLYLGATYAPLPFVIVAHYQYQVAGLWGWGGYELYVWYVSDARMIARQTEWIS